MPRLRARPGQSVGQAIGEDGVVVAHQAGGCVDAARPQFAQHVQAAADGGAVFQGHLGAVLDGGAVGQWIAEGHAEFQQVAVGGDGLDYSQRRFAVGIAQGEIGHEGGAAGGRGAGKGGGNLGLSGLFSRLGSHMLFLGASGLWVNAQRGVWRKETLVPG